MSKWVTILGLFAVTTTCFAATASESAQAKSCRRFSPSREDVTYCEGDTVLVHRKGGYIQVKASASTAGPFQHYYDEAGVEQEGMLVLTKKDVCAQAATGEKYCAGTKYENAYGGHDEILGYFLYQEDKPLFVVSTFVNGKKNDTYMSNAEVVTRAKKTTQIQDQIVVDTQFSVPAKRQPSPAELSSLVDNSTALAQEGARDGIFKDCELKVGQYNKRSISAFAIDKSSCRWQYSQSSSSINWDYGIPGGDRSGFIQKYPGHVLFMCKARVNYICNYTPQD
jgi:hypothetical protein